jgi:UDP-glucose 4-epimerase
VHGDGLQSRDFTFITDAVAANLRAAEAPARQCAGGAYNVAGGASYSLLELIATLQRLIGVEVAPSHVGPRAGDVRHTRADITAAAADLGHRPAVSFDEGLARTVEWCRARLG